MNTKSERVEADSSLIRSIVLGVLGLLCIPLGLSVFPGMGIVIGAALIGMAVYPWVSFAPLRFTNRKKVNILVGTVTDNNLNSRLLPVAILSSTKEHGGLDFDPRQVDPESVSFGPLRARPEGNLSDPQIYQRSMVDVNGDGIPDIVLYFSGDTAGITSREEEVCLRAKTWEGERILGCGRVEHGYDRGLNELLEHR